MSATIPAAYTRFLEEPLFGNLGTIRPDDTVQVNPMWFEFDGEFVRFTHTTKRAKYRNLQHNPSMSLSISDPDDPYDFIELRGRLADVDPGPDRRVLRPARAALRQCRPAAAAGQRRPRHPGDERGHRRHQVSPWERGRLRRLFGLRY